MGERRTDPQTDLLSWLLERDTANPGVRYLALRYLLDLPPDDPEVMAAQAATMRTGPVPVILDAQYPQGHWVRPGPGYSPKYRATLWSVIFLPQLGADGRDARIGRAVEHVFAHAQTERGAFSCNGHPEAVIYCLWGNVVRALLDLGHWPDPRLVRSVEALAQAVVDAGPAPTTPTRGTTHSPFACDANRDLPCAWGAVRVLWALNGVAQADRTPVMERAVAASADFLLSHDLTRADYPTPTRVSPRWFKFGYPLAYATDVLLALEVLAAAGADPAQLEDAVGLVRSKQDDQGRWRMESSYNGRMWADVEEKGRPSKWVTLRAVRTLKRLEENSPRSS
ncbi:MAG: nitrogen fixation protein NifH [Anaerolineae bacterium]|jgi:hypothetical protein